MTRLPRILVVILVLVIAGVAQHRREDQPLTDELYELEAQRTKAIRAELISSTDEWAGTYAAGDHHPTVFLIAPREGFLVTSSRHTFASSWINYGRVRFDAMSVQVFPELAKENRYAHVMPTEFRKVRWGQRHFLIPPEELRAFAWAAHSRSESEIIQFFARYDDRDKLRNGVPDLPAEFQKYVTMKPIVGRITAVGKNEGPWTTATISVGRLQGVVKGMNLYYMYRGVQASFRVAEVSDTSAKVDVHVMDMSGSGEAAAKVGWKVSSRMPKGFIEPG